MRLLAAILLPTLVCQNPPPVIPPAPPVGVQTIRPAGRPAPPGQKPPAAPSPLGRPSARFQLLFLQYRRADSDAAIDALSKWTEGELLAEAVPSPNDDIWTRAALVAFLTETGMRSGKFGYYSFYSPQWILDKSWGLDKNYEVYAFRSYAIVKDLTRTATLRHDDALLQFCARWYVMTVSYSLRYRRPARIGLQAMADHDLIDTVEIRLLIGSVGEPLGEPIGSPPPPPRIIPPGIQQGLWAMKEVLRRDPANVEAHLRLGHLRRLINENIEARAHLERALHDATERRLSFLAYMAGIFLGELDEHENRIADAITHFRAAVAADPGAHLANIALGDALLRSGDASGWAEARQMFDGEDQNHPKSLDPVYYYRFAQYWNLAALLREMRKTARGEP